tara:strand:- start:1017 stop:2855 length:1839 start_codon:yes stop_codon:yes gene_type:complete
MLKMKKTIILSAISVLVMLSPSVMASIEVGTKVSVVNKEAGLSKTVNLIVQFRDKNIHKALLANPKTLEKLERKAKADNVSLISLKKTYNVQSNVAYEYGVSSLKSLSEKNSIQFEHVRSMSMGADVVKVTSDSPIALQNLIVELINSGDFDSVMVDDVVKKMNFNDTLYNEQPQFKQPSPSTGDGQNFEAMRSKVVNNLGRKIRIGVVDSGYAPHEDINPLVEGYDFTQEENGTYLEAKTRDANPTDLSILADGLPCHDGHGLSVAGLIGATSNNGLGVAGAVDSEEADLVYARVLNCFGEGASSDILDAVAWMIQEEVPEVPTIAAPVDIMNLSLGGYRISGCATYEQAVYTKARDKGIVVVVAAGNSNDDAKTFAPASCNDVITVGAISRKGDKASFSNYGDNIDVMAAGSGLWMIASNEYKTQELYFRGSGTSMSAPLITAAAANLLLTHPTLTPDQIEGILSANGQGSKPGSLCAQLGCGKGSVNASNVMDAIPNLLTSIKYEKKHRYEGYNSPEQKVWLDKMNHYANVCNMVKYTWGNLGTELSGVEYKLYVGSNDELVYTETISTPQKVLSHDKETLVGVQTCRNGACGSVVQMRGNITSPSSCL